MYPSLDLADRPAIRGQLEGLISFGFNVLDQVDRPWGFHLCGNPDKQKTVARAFASVNRMSRELRETFRLG